MGHRPTPLVEILRDARQALDDDSARLLSAIMADYPASLAVPPAELLLSTNSSPVTLERIVAATGVGDFAELQRRAAEEIDAGLRSPGLRFAARLARPTNAAALVDRMVPHEAGNVRSTLASLRDTGALEMAAARIVAARSRFLLGQRKSYAFAHLLGADLATFLARVVIVDGVAVRGPDFLLDTSKDDVFIAFSLRRYAATTITWARMARERGVTVIGVTDSIDGALGQMADIPLIAATSSESFADSPTAIAAVVHALAALCAARAKGAKRRLAEHERLSREMSVYDER
jgi:DNA-binding MurR/RpiR family transcriptional regulator